MASCEIALCIINYKINSNFNSSKTGVLDLTLPSFLKVNNETSTSNTGISTLQKQVP